MPAAGTSNSALKNLKEQRYILSHLKNLKSSKERNAILKVCSNDAIKCIAECVLNILNGNIPITNNEKKKLLKYKTKMRNIANRKVSLQRTRSLIQQGDGFFLPLILSTIASSVISDLFKKNE